MLLLEKHMLEANHDDNFFFFGKFVNFCLVFPTHMIDLQIGRKKPLMCMHKRMHARAFLHTHTHTQPSTFRHFLLHSKPSENTGTFVLTVIISLLVTPLVDVLD